MTNMTANEPERARNLQAMLAPVCQRISSSTPRMTEHLTPSQRPPPPAPAPTPQPALNANNLQKHGEQLAEARRAKLAQNTQGGRMSPDGSPPILIRSKLTVNDLKLPTNPRKRKLGDTPQDPSSPSKMRSPKTANASALGPPNSPQVNGQPSLEVEKNFKCTRTGCSGAFALERELQTHLDNHDREDQRAEFMRTDPVNYTIQAVANGLNLNPDGTPKSSKQSQIGLTPGQSMQTPRGKSPAMRHSVLPVYPVRGSKAILPDGEQMPTPPETSWDLSGTPDMLGQCFSGLKEEILPLAAMDISFFTPADTPEDSPGEDGKASVPPAVNTYRDWNPFGLKDTFGEEILQEFHWDSDVPVVSATDGANWGEVNGFALYCDLKE